MCPLKAALKPARASSAIAVEVSLSVVKSTMTPLLPPFRVSYRGQPHKWYNRHQRGKSVIGRADMPGNAASPIIRVALVATPSSAASSLFGFRDTLTSVGVAWETYVTGETAAPRFEVSFVGTTTDPFVCVSGTEIRPEFSIETVGALDIVVVSPTVGPIDV